MLARVNSLLLAPHVALHEADVPVSSVLRPDVLERTGMRAALAYLRIAAAGDAMAPTTSSRSCAARPAACRSGSPTACSAGPGGRWPSSSALADQVPDKDAPKVLRLVDDLRVVVDAGRAGTTRHVLEAVRDDIGLGAAMSLLDRTGGGQGSSHLDDIDGLLGVADLHPDPGGFEPWLRAVFKRETAPDGVTLSTVHRVKGREWDRVAVFGVTDGIVPHRLAEDVEEERRVLHVAITRGRHRVAVLADRTRRSPFLDELTGTAPKTAPHARSARSTPARGRAGEGRARWHRGRRRASSSPCRAATRARSRRSTAAPPSCAGLRAPRCACGSASGSSSTAARRRSPRRASCGARRPAPRPLLRAWRTKRSQADGVPAYIVVNDKHLRGIALARPTTPAELVACDGIGPAKLERYGDEILELLADL